MHAARGNFAKVWLAAAMAAFICAGTLMVFWADIRAAIDRVGNQPEMCRSRV
jgi:hypothetical protein